MCHEKDYRSEMVSMLRMLADKVESGVPLRTCTGHLHAHKRELVAPEIQTIFEEKMNLIVDRSEFTGRVEASIYLDYYDEKQKG